MGHIMGDQPSAGGQTRPAATKHTQRPAEAWSTGLRAKRGSRESQKENDGTTKSAKKHENSVDGSRNTMNERNDREHESRVISSRFFVPFRAFRGLSLSSLRKNEPATAGRGK
jgi:hypothetical protein